MQYMTKRVETPSYIHFLSKDGERINGTRCVVHLPTQDTCMAEAIIIETAALYNWPKNVCIEYTFTYDEPAGHWLATWYLPRE